MDILYNSDITLWKQGNASFEVLMTKYHCTIAQLADGLEVPHPENIIAFRHVQEWWPFEFVSIIMAARAMYDSGHVELATGRTGNHFFLYSFVRKVPGKHRNYFSYTPPED
jgi:hypothetical protein